MKIAWFSPLPPLKSGISEYSELILQDFKNQAQIDLWVDGFSPRLEFYKDYRVIDYINQPDVMPLLKTYDTIIYNMGNNVEFHSNMYEVLQDYPGVVILHDYVLHHFLVGYWLNRKNNPARYLEEVRKQYGPEVEEEARKSLRLISTPLWETEEVFQYPLNKTVLEKATAIVVHSNFLKKLLKKEVSKEVIKINMPVSPIPDAALSKNRQELNLPQDKIVLAAFGFIGPVKRFHKVLSAIAKNKKLRDSVFTIIIGESVCPDYQLDKYVARLNLNNQVKLLGYLPLQQAYAYLNCADICFNLKYPTMGETSSSLIRIMSLGKPTLVSNVGWCAELPDNCVVKIDPGQEERQLNTRLSCLIKDAALRKQIGDAAKDYVQNNCSADYFIRGLIDFLEKVPRQQGKNLLYMHLLDVVAGIMTEINGTDMLISQVANQLTWARSKEET